MGGIVSASDALEFIIAGADLVAIGTANFINPKASIEAIRGIESFLKSHRYHSVSDIRGKLKVKENHQLGATAG